MHACAHAWVIWRVDAAIEAHNAAPAGLLTVMHACVATTRTSMSLCSLAWPGLAWNIACCLTAAPPDLVCVRVCVCAGMLATHLHDVIERTAQLHADGRLAHFAMDTETDSE